MLAIPHFYKICRVTFVTLLAIVGVMSDTAFAMAQHTEVDHDAILSSSRHPQNRRIRFPGRATPPTVDFLNQALKSNGLDADVALCMTCAVPEKQVC